VARPGGVAATGRRWRDKQWGPNWSLDTDRHHGLIDSSYKRADQGYPRREQLAATGANRIQGCGTRDKSRSIGGGGEARGVILLDGDLILRRLRSALRRA